MAIDKSRAIQVLATSTTMTGAASALGIATDKVRALLEDDEILYPAAALTLDEQREDMRGLFSMASSMTRGEIEAAKDAIAKKSGRLAIKEARRRVPHGTFEELSAEVRRRADA